MESDPHTDAPEIESHRRDRAGVVRELRGRGPDAPLRACDGRELHGHQGAARPHLPGGVGPDQGERIRAYSCMVTTHVTTASIYCHSVACAFTDPSGAPIILKPFLFPAPTRPRAAPQGQIGGRDSQNIQHQQRLLAGRGGSGMGGGDDKSD